MRVEKDDGARGVRISCAEIKENKIHSEKEPDRYTVFEIPTVQEDIFTLAPRLQPQEERCYKGSEGRGQNRWNTNIAYLDTHQIAAPKEAHENEQQHPVYRNGVRMILDLRHRISLTWYSHGTRRYAALRGKVPISGQPSIYWLCLRILMTRSPAYRMTAGTLSICTHLRR